MKIAIIGGGINGLMMAWGLCKNNHNVILSEKGTLMSQTSSASSKLLHGGLRYLENLEFRLVREVLRERQWWIDRASYLAQPIEIFIPIYKQLRRPALLYKVGLFLYDLLAGSKKLRKHEKDNKTSMQEPCPDLKKDELLENTSIDKINIYGEISCKDHKEKFDKVINITGPWSHQLLKDNMIESDYELDLVRGSHIIILKELDFISNCRSAYEI